MYQSLLESSTAPPLKGTLSVNSGDPSCNLAMPDNSDKISIAFISKKVTFADKPTMNVNSLKKQKHRKLIHT